MFRYVIAFLAILFLSHTAIADSKIVGHMAPLSGEKLEQPVALDCGAIIQEVRGFHPNYAVLNSMCTHAYSNFFKFVKAKGLQYNHSEQFQWNLSFLPEERCYRCLNDEAYRFRHRHVQGYLIGYTDRDERYAFMSNVVDGEFNTTFVHELFHAMSMYYGVYDNHPGNYAQKTAQDEKLAQDFTEWLGYGR
jgi:hypothetical protein